MNKRYYRVEDKCIDTKLTYDSDESNYGFTLNFEKYQNFLNAYLLVMKHNNISADVFFMINNNFAVYGDRYCEVLSNSIINQHFIDIDHLLNINNHKNQRIDVKFINLFIESISNNGNFVYLNSGIYLWETILEMIRKEDIFKKHPNRLKSKFFFTDIDSCDYYNKNHLKGSGKIYEIEIIKTRKYFEGDMIIIDRVKNDILFNDLISEFTNYWNGYNTKRPILEVIFQGVFKYKNIV